MPIVAKVEIRKTKEAFDFFPGSLDVNPGDMCLVETENGLEVGKVVSPEKMIEKKKKNFFRVIRKLTKKDVEITKRNREKNNEAFKKVLEKVKEYELEMKLTCVDYTFDRRKLFVYYTAEGRVDFRQLIKDLGKILKTRIQMVQIGVRDEAKLIGGFGPCGLPLCCHRFLREFKPPTLEMVKDQDLSLSLSKISGVCGRLMCCLVYENEFYKNAKRQMPQMNSKVNTKDGVGTVKGVSILSGKVTVEYGDGTFKNWQASEISLIKID